MKVKIKCDYCNKVIYKYQSHFKKHQHHFCNTYCKGRWWSKHITNNNHPRWNRKSSKCDYCHKIIYKLLSSMKQSEHHFCSYACHHAHRTKHSIKKVRCNECHKIFVRKNYILKKYKHHFCSSQCQGKWNSKYRSGKNSPLWNLKSCKCSYCNKIFYRPLWWIRQNKDNLCDNQCKNRWQSKYRSGRYSSNWIDGRSFNPYASEFNNELKEFIRKRDMHQCQNHQCGIPEKECLIRLDIHHIDYNKKNNDPINLIALCRYCNAKANFNRKYWQEYYENIQISRKVHEMEKL